MSDPVKHNWPLETFHYNPDKDLAIAAAAGYGLLLNILAYRLWRRRSFWAWLAPAAPAQLALGFAFRYYGVKSAPDKLVLNVLSQIFIVGFVGGYLIFNYVVYKKILETFTTSRDRYSLLRPEIAFWVLSICDIATFSLQGAGAGLRATVDHQGAGRVIFLIGIIVQAITYSSFIVMLVYSHRVFRNDVKFDNYNFPWLLLWAMYLSSLCIMIRTIYRFAELVQGNNGELFTHEKYFYALDVLPIVISIGIYAIFWPGSLIAKACAQESPQFPMNHTGAANA